MECTARVTDDGSGNAEMPNLDVGFLAQYVLSGICFYVYCVAGVDVLGGFTG